MTEISFGLIRAAQSLHIPVIASMHGSDLTAIQYEFDRRRAFWEEYLESCDQIVGCSNNFARRIEHQLADLSTQVVAINNGIDAGVFSQADPSVRWPAVFQDSVLIVSVGTFEHKKGHDVTLRAFARIRQHYPKSHLVLVGRNGPEYASLMALSKQLGLSSHVTYLVDLPFVSVLALYQIATLFVSSSRSEPFGLGLIEAGLAGLPVIASRSDGALNIIKDKERGLLVEVDDSAALATSMATLLEDQALREKYGTNLKRFVVETFSWNKTLNQYLQTVEELHLPQLQQDAEHPLAEARRA